jgi:hypothetical protein
MFDVNHGLHLENLMAPLGIIFFFFFNVFFFSNQLSVAVHKSQNILLLKRDAFYKLVIFFYLCKVKWCCFIRNNPLVVRNSFKDYKFSVEVLVNLKNRCIVTGSIHIVWR